MTPIPVNAQPFLSAITQHMDTFNDLLELDATPYSLAICLRAAALAATRAADEFTHAVPKAKP